MCGSSAIALCSICGICDISLFVVLLLVNYVLQLMPSSHAVVRLCDSSTMTLCLTCGICYLYLSQFLPACGRTTACKWGIADKVVHGCVLSTCLNWRNCCIDHAYVCIIYCFFGYMQRGKQFQSGNIIELWENRTICCASIIISFEDFNSNGIINSK